MTTLLNVSTTQRVQSTQIQAVLNRPCLFSMLESHVKRGSEQIVIQHQGSSISYAEFHQRIHQNARYLNQLVATKEKCIGLFCDPSIEMFTGVWGILASERAYLPLAPEYPEERIRYMVEDSGIQFILTQEHLKAHLLSIIPPQVRVLTQSDLKVMSDIEQPVNHLSQCRDRLAYIIYTSGSSGKPKGVVVSYENISHQIEFMRTQFGFNESTCLLQKTPSSFDAAQWEILAPAFGGKVVIGAKDCYRNPDLMIDTILNEKVSVLQCVPTLLQALVDHPLLTDCQSLKQVFSGGETLTRNLAKAFFQRLGNTSLTNLYGPTECTINASSFTLSRDALDSYPEAISIGKPVTNVLYHVLKKDGQLAGVDEPGELYISGVQVAQGYYRRAEMTAEKFIPNTRVFLPGHEVMYKTGDLVRLDAKGDAHFLGRADNQIKLRGYRVELDEIRLAIESHQWIKTAAMVVKNDLRLGHQNLIAVVQLDEKQASVMDQGNHGAHHQSKSNKFQVKAQLSNSGCRDIAAFDDHHVFPLPGKVATAQQRARAFARKTYRFFDGEQKVSKTMLLNLLERQPVAPDFAADVSTWSLLDFSTLLRNFGQFISKQRLLPKYTYASPGALYATQMYFEINGVLGLQGGIYYYHPVEHCLVRICSLQVPSTEHRLNVHFIGKCAAIEPVYKNNILEVLEMETGHMLGLFDELLPEYALSVTENLHTPMGTLPAWYDGDAEDFYLASYRFEGYKPAQNPVNLEYFLQVHGDKVAGLGAGLYRYQDGGLHYLSAQMIEKSDVIAINQKVFERASFGIGLVCNGGNRDRHYIQLGRTLHRLQSNLSLIGLMSSGYSSKTNNDLSSAVKMRAILAQHERAMESFYFAIGGPISEVQYQSEGMNEDRVHMRGPAEMLKDELALQLPQYMIPNRVIVVDKLPQTANGKIDHLALHKLNELSNMDADRELVPPRTETEKKMAALWCQVMKWDSISTTDDFFEWGGNSLTAISLINRINASFAISMPLQVLFETPHIIGLAKWIETNQQEQPRCSRLIRLNQKKGKPIFCWPGLGGSAMGLKLMANELVNDQAFYGIQAVGINDGETPVASIEEMAQQDIEQIKTVQPQGPYTLWGYSFGARVAFETAAQLEAMGEKVDALYLLAPGAPITQMERERTYKHEARFDNPVFLAIMFSVFANKIDGKLMERCLELCRTEDEFIDFICQRFPVLEPALVRRIVRIVMVTYGFSYQFKELYNRRLNAPITIIKARGDHYAFLQDAPPFSQQPPQYLELNVDHYQVLKEAGLSELKHKLLSTRTDVL